MMGPAYLSLSPLLSEQQWWLDTGCGSARLQRRVGQFSEAGAERWVEGLNLRHVDADEGLVVALEWTVDTEDRVIGQVWQVDRARLEPEGRFWHRAAVPETLEPRVQESRDAPSCRCC